MALFSKKKKTEEEELELEDGGEEKSGGKRVFKKKDFKDLNSDNKKTRREPKKPWGKKERILVASLLLLTAGISAYLWIISSGGLSKIGIDFSKIFGEETIIIEGNK